MEFHYYYVVQDVVGVLVGALALKMIALYMMHMLKRGITGHDILCTMGNAMIFLSGTILVASPFGLRPWIGFLLLLISGWAFAYAAVRLKKHGHYAEDQTE